MNNARNSRLSQSQSGQSQQVGQGEGLGVEQGQEKGGEFFYNLVLGVKSVQKTRKTSCRIIY